jgi:hypothetical protein
VPNLTLYDQDRMAFKITNPGRVAADVTLLYVDSGHGIDVLFPQDEDNRIRPGESVTALTKLNSKTTGPEHLVVIAVKGTGQRINFAPLAQPTLTQARARGGDGALDTPLGRLVKRAVFGDGDARGMTADEVEDALVTLMSWQIKAEKRTSEK